MMPNMSKSAKPGKFQRISRVPENSEEAPEKSESLIFWVQNQFQWLKLSGNDAQYVEIGQK